MAVMPRRRCAAAKSYRPQRDTSLPWSAGFGSSQKEVPAVPRVSGRLFTPLKGLDQRSLAYQGPPLPPLGVTGGGGLLHPPVKPNHARPARAPRGVSAHEGVNVSLREMLP